MTKEQYKTIHLADLRVLARSRGIKRTSTMKKNDIIEAMLALDREEEAKNGAGAAPAEGTQNHAGAVSAEEKRDQAGQASAAEEAQSHVEPASAAEAVKDQDGAALVLTEI